MTAIDFLNAALVFLGVAAALTSGIVFTFSNSVMPALGRLEAPAAVHAMQVINVQVINPLFLVVFMGTGPLAVALSVWQAVTMDAVNGPLLAGAIVYMAGVFFVTAFGNVPLNDALEKVALDPPPVAETWRGYARPWLRWNHLRTVMAAVASALFISAIGA